MCGRYIATLNDPIPVLFYDRFKTGYIRVHSVHAAPRDVVQNVQKKDGVTRA